ncbi:BON domain-containing protein [Catenovulum adriaticum]|uniref:BON domain-containing protein n=1 Tax=Catenovulum adriaticum TaxID=2984846 RepID=A0ABY7AP88_9ALTE|nr:BON domain-containing protein [Catenovulum sp. TS8]WAJ70542.1 BON domain-containing protein [Catenovulum sp. TS8]
MKLTQTQSVITAALLSVSAMSVSANNNWENEAKDAWIDGKAESTLLLNTNLNSFDINTDVKDGRVTLTGRVDSEIDKALAEELVENLEGVEDIDNEITVQSESDVKDEPNEMLSSLKDSKVASVVKTRLLMESEVSGTDIDVDSKNGVVILQGEVDTKAEQDLAIAIAKNTNDVKEVIDNIEIIN